MSRSRCPVCWHEVDVPELVPKAFLRLVRSLLADKVDEALAEAARRVKRPGEALPEVLGWLSRRMRPSLRTALLRVVREELRKVSAGELGPDE